MALALADQAELPVAVIDPQSGRIQSINEPFTNLFDVEADALEGQRFRDVVPEDERWKIRDALSVAAFGGSPSPVTVQLQLPGSDEASKSVWQLVPNILEPPSRPVAVVCRPKGRSVGHPIGPPEFLESDGDGLERIPPRQRLKEAKRMSETSRYLWD